MFGTIWELYSYVVKISRLFQFKDGYLLGQFHSVVRHRKYVECHYSTDPRKRLRKIVSHEMSKKIIDFQDFACRAQRVLEYNLVFCLHLKTFLRELTWISDISNELNDIIQNKTW